MTSPLSRFISRPKVPTAMSDDAATSPVVLAWRPLSDLSGVRENVLRKDATMAELLFELVRETAAARNHEARLLRVICDFAFRMFPSATHTVLAIENEEGPGLRTLFARSRSGEEPAVALSRTVVARAMSEGVALLVSQGQMDLDVTQSVTLSGMETAIVAPLISEGRPFGVIQLDIRRPGKGMFVREDVDLLSMFASQVALTLEHLRLHQQQARAFHSTIHALVHSLLLKDPEAAHHSERVQEIAQAIGNELGLPEPQLEALSVAALLHDLGKQGVRDEVLFKPAKLTVEEREEMSRHAAHTQNILDKIVYPDSLRDVPRLAAWHHERPDGKGPFGLVGDRIPIESRIIAVSDAFDALMTARAYKEALPLKMVMKILLRGRGTEWDAQVVNKLRELAIVIKAAIYDAASSPAEAGVAPYEPLPDDPMPHTGLEDKDDAAEDAA